MLSICSSSLLDLTLTENDSSALSTLFQGKYTEAEQLYERCQAIYEKVTGPEHPLVATTLGNRAWLLASQVGVELNPGKRVYR